MAFQVATINSEIVDSVLSMAGLTFFVLGLTNEWLASMNALMSEDTPNSNNGKYNLLHLYGISTAVQIL